MRQAAANPYRERISFAKLESIQAIPDLVEIQQKSYEWFLMPDAPILAKEDGTVETVRDQRVQVREGNNSLRDYKLKNYHSALVKKGDQVYKGEAIADRNIQGLQSVFSEIFPIVDSHASSDKSLRLEYDGYILGQPKYSEHECCIKDQTYAVPLKIKVRLCIIEKSREGERLREMREQHVYMGDIPLMTSRGTFIINGAERVIVNQVHRSPGVVLDHDEGKTDPSGKRLYTSKILPYRGAWIEFEYEVGEILNVRIDRKRKLPVTALLKALVAIAQDNETAHSLARTGDILKRFCPIQDLPVSAALVKQAEEWSRKKEENDIWFAEDFNTGTEQRDLVWCAGERLTEESWARWAWLHEQKTRENDETYCSQHEKCATSRGDRLFCRKDRDGKDCAVVQSGPQAGSCEKCGAVRKYSDRHEYCSRCGKKIPKGFSFKPGEPIDFDAAVKQLKAWGISTLKVVVINNDNRDRTRENDRTILETIGEERKFTPKTSFRPDLTAQEAVLNIVDAIRPGEQMTLSQACDELRKLIFDQRRYDLGEVGRYQLNRKLGFDRKINAKTGAPVDATGKEALNKRVLSPEDIVAVVDDLIGLNVSQGATDDTDHLANRRVRSVGELLQNQFRVGLSRMEKVIQQRMTTQDEDTMTPQELINIKPVTGIVKEFFGSSQLSQFMDQTNPLAELTHKRRLSALGPGGLKRERALSDVRDVHRTHYGRICPIETPEGPNIGLIVSLATFARVNDFGFIEAPYRKVIDGKVTDDVEWLTADAEDRCIVAQANSEINDKTKKFVEDRVFARHRTQYYFSPVGDVQFMDVSPEMVVSVSTALIPFLEHDDANRALMGSNMQRQAVPLLVPEAPRVGTGMEFRAAYDSGAVVVAEEDGVVEYVDAAKILVKDKEKAAKLAPRQYDLFKFHRSNQSTCINQRPLVRRGDNLKKGQVIADGASTDKGELALGRNVIVAFMSWEGYNFEDAIVVSNRIVKDDVFTSIHIESFDIEARDTKIGKEVITKDIPNVGDDAKKHLNDEGIVRIGSWVKPTDILVGKVTPKGSIDLTPEHKLLYSIFGERARDVRDTSLRVPHGTEGMVIDVKPFTRQNGDELGPGVEMKVKVLVANKRKLTVGDKMAGRHGNKGVVSIVVPEEDMPFMEDGTPVDIVLNPLGVPSRMNIGQILETHFGWAAHHLDIHVATPVFNGANEHEIKYHLADAGLSPSGKSTIFDGKTGDKIASDVVVGVMYMLKLNHLVDDKIHARSTGPYSLVTQQPLGGKAQFGGQRLGEMEVWALEAYGSAYTLQELLTVKSDDVVGRSKVYEAIVKGDNAPPPGIPESFNVLVRELQGLALDVQVLDDKDNVIELEQSDENEAMSGMPGSQSKGSRRSEF